MNKSAFNFFIVTPLGFEEEAIQEIKEVWPYLIQQDSQQNMQALVYDSDKGGISLQTEPILAYQLNYFLKTPSRILERLIEFKAKDFPTLYKKLINFKLENFCFPGVFNLHISSSQSRLSIEKRIKGVIEDVIQEKKLNHNPSASKGPIYNYDLFIRILDDQVTLSIDTSGNHLHMRAWAIHKEEAPIRETIAAFCLRELMKDVSTSELRKIQLVDPMVGSGTLLFEAMTLFMPNFKRKFAFQSFKNAPKILNSETFFKNYTYQFLPPYKNYLGMDKSAKAIESCNKNYIQLLKLTDEVAREFRSKPDLSDLQFQFKVEDFSSNLSHGNSNNFSEKKVWVISNPPYGQRIKVDSDIIRNFISICNQKLSAERVGLVLPVNQINELIIPSDWKIKAKVPFSNGGLDVQFTIFEKN